jgi:hypothetical protein
MMRPEQFLETGASLSLQALVLIAATVAVGSLTGSAVIRCRLWTTCFWLLLALSLVGVLLPHWRPLRVAAVLEPADIVRVGRWEQLAGSFAWIMWLVGAIVSLLLLIAGLIAAKIRLRTCERVNPHELGDIGRFNDGDQLRSVQFVRGDGIASPGCWQTQIPTILLPNAFFQMDPGQRRFIILHELEHLRGGHSLQVVLGRLAAVVFWFHPAVWWATRQAALAREYACDERCVRDRHEILEYLRSLLVMAEGIRNAGRSYCLHFAWGPTVISRRTQRLMWLAQRSHSSWDRHFFRDVWSQIVLCGFGLTLAAVWLPTNVFASPRSNWTPWPTWTAGALHDVGVTVRDHEIYDRRIRVQELRERID